MTIVQQTTFVQTGPGNNATPSLTGVVAGHSLVIPIAGGGMTDALPVDSTGQIWQKANFNTQGTVNNACYWLPSANAGTHSITWPLGSNPDVGVAGIMGETLPLSAVDVVSTPVTGSGVSTGQTATITTLNASDACFALSAINPQNGSSNNHQNVPSGWTAGTTQSNTLVNYGVGIAYQEETTAGAKSAAFSYDSDTMTDRMAMIVSFKFAGGATTSMTLSASTAVSAAKASAAKAIRAASTTTSAAKAAAVSAVRSASTSTSAAVARATSAIRSAGTTGAAAIVRRIQATKSAASPVLATLATVKMKIMTLSAAVTGSATVQRAVSAIRSSSTSTVATTAKAVSAIRAASSSTTATLTAIKTKLLTLSASVTTTAARVLTVQGIRSASTATAASATKGVRAIQAAAATTAGAVQKAVSATRSAATTCLATLATIKAKLLTLSAGVSTTATLSRAVSAIRSASTVCVASVQKKVNLIRSAGVTCGAAARKLTAATRAAIQATTASIGMTRLRLLVLTALVVMSGQLVKLIRAIRSASTGLIANLIAQSSAATVAMLGPVWRAAARLTNWLVAGRSSNVRVDERSTLWVAGRHRTMGEPIDKRTDEQLVITIDCTPLLDPAETILNVLSISADQGSMTLGTPTKNAAPIVAKDGRTIAIGKALQVEIDNGAIPDGRAFLVCYLRPLISTTVDGSTIYQPKREPTTIVRLIDNPPA